MKKVALILVLLCYLAGILGLPLIHHYCMGRYDGASLVSKQICGSCNMQLLESSSGCCHSETETLTLSDDHAPSNMAILPIWTPPCDQITHDTPISSLCPPRLVATNPDGRPPPLYSVKSPIFLLVSNFRL